MPISSALAARRWSSRCWPPVGNALGSAARRLHPCRAHVAPALLSLDAWVTPPVYTGVAPIVLADGSETVGAGAETFRALSVPERSELIVRAFAPRGETVSLVTSLTTAPRPRLISRRSTGSQGLMEFNVALDLARQRRCEDRRPRPSPNGAST